MKLFILFLLISFNLSSQSFFSSNSGESKFEGHSLDSYKDVIAFNKLNQNKINLRGRKLHKLDSIITWRKALENNSIKRYFKSEYFLEDQAPKEILVLSNPGIGNSNWQPESYAAFHFNKNNFLIKQTFNAFDEELDEKDPEFIRWYTYDENDLLVKFEEATRREIQLQKIKTTIDYFYNEEGLLNRMSRYFWYETRDSTFHTRESIFRHDEQNNLRQVVNWKFSFDNGWSYADSTSLRYDSEGRIAEELYYVWIDDAFKATDRLIYEYDMYDIFYGDLYSITQWERFDVDDQKWRRGNVQLFQYNPDASIKEILTRALDNNNAWSDQIRNISYNYSSFMNTENILLPRFFTIEGATDNALLQKTEHVGSSNSNVNFNYRDVLHYSDIRTNTVDLEEKEIVNVYPNPALDFFFVNLPNPELPFSIDIFNANSTTLLSVKNTTESKIDLSSLSSGMYFYSVYVGGKTHVGKFVKL